MVGVIGVAIGVMAVMGTLMAFSSPSSATPQASEARGRASVEATPAPEPEPSGGALQWLGEALQTVVDAQEAERQAAVQAEAERQAQEARRQAQEAEAARQAQEAEAARQAQEAEAARQAAAPPAPTPQPVTAQAAPAPPPQPSYVASGGVQQWASLTSQVMADLGIPQGYLQGILGQMNSESGGNPNAYNGWDSNAAAGIPSQGLMQVIPPTFAAYTAPGCTNILDPYCNIYAGLNWAINRYGYSRFDLWAQGIHYGY